MPCQGGGTQLQSQLLQVTWEAETEGSKVQSLLGQFSKTLSRQKTKNSWGYSSVVECFCNRSKMGWRCGSSNRVPALQAQSSEFKLQSCHPKNLPFAPVQRTFSNCSFSLIAGGCENLSQGLIFFSG
jgi:hypothetical protein